MINSLFEKISQRIITLKASMMAIFISLFLGLILLILLVTTIRYTKILTYIAYDLTNYASATILNELKTYMRPAEVESRFMARLISQNIIKDSEENLVPLTVDIIRNLPLAIGAYWGDQQGNYIHSKRELDNTITTEVYNRRHYPPTRFFIYHSNDDKVTKKVPSSTSNYDPRGRPWFILAKKERKNIWTNIYFFESSPDLGISTASPVFKNDVFYGAFGIHIDLTYLTQFIKTHKASPNSYSFIITKDGQMLVHPDKKPFSDEDISASALININTHPMPLIAQSLEHYKQSGQEKLTFSFVYEKKTYMITYEQIPAMARYGWLIGIIIPRSDLTKDLQKMNLITISISFIILFLGILLVSLLTSHIVKPIKALVRETENIKDFNLDEEIPISSKIKEIINLRDSVRSMKIGLKLFQKYIPKVLVKQLIESGENLRSGVVRKELAVFFSDIQNFTSFAEKTEPPALMAQISEYFEELTQIIIREKGTIDKYIGDSIMAFWGAPLSNAHSCQHAARAALRCQAKMDRINSEWIKKGMQPFFTRIGLHTGEAIVGNLGSSERISYTALGDTVNKASRLENINKYYKTRIIASEEVYIKIKDEFELRMIDCVIVKGRTQSSFIYELLSEDSHSIEFDIISYRLLFEQGFWAYKDQRWDEAINYFKSCVDIYPADNIAPMFITRCKHFKSHPPAAQWDGAVQITPN